MSKLDTSPYKGVRDFYPEDEAIEQYIFGVWRKVLESFGYVPYNASILESAELYRAKSGGEIVSEQTYTFKDRGDREVTLRPEMTPTVARMVAGRKRELGFPLRWYSIPNLFRYEAPQRGRLREHWQLNADIFGLENIQAEVEIIEIAWQIMRAFKAKEDDFIIKLNSRKIVNRIYSLFDLDDEHSQKISKLIDKKQKISPDAFETSLREVLGEKTSDFIAIFDSPEKIFDTLGKDSAEVQEIFKISAALEALGITNITFDQTLMRGFDYYTGVIFEVFDTNKENPRSLFGGGRYDDLISLFGSEKVSAVGIAAGDVTTRDFLETHGLLPAYASQVRLYIAVAGDKLAEVTKLADQIRAQGVAVAVDWSGRKLGDQLKTADKHRVPYVCVVGDDELTNGKFKIKNLASGEEREVSIEDIGLCVK